MATGCRTLWLSIGALAMAMVIQVSGYLDVHNLSPIGWPFLSLGIAVLSLTVILWFVVRAANDALNKQWRKAGESLVFVTLLLSLNMRPTIWSDILDRIRFACCSSQERQLLETAAKLRSGNEVVFLILWGESGFAGSNLFTYLMRTGDENMFQRPLQSKGISGVYITKDQIANPHFQIRSECKPEVHHISGGYFVVRSSC